MSSIRDVVQHYLLNMLQIVIPGKFPISCDDYLQAYITPQKLNIWTISTLGQPPRTFLTTQLQATNMAAEVKNV